MEWEMFVRVNSSQAKTSSCQNSPDNFKDIRGSVFEIWTEEMLTAYLEQLKNAKALGRNLLTEKYARMDNLIPPLTDSLFIEDIVAINCTWQNELHERYPSLYMRCSRGTDPTGDGSNFAIYLSSELETYGDRTLEIYYRNVKNAEEQGRNLSIEALQRLVEKSGYQDLDDAENCLLNEALQS
jgi:hypothetical protein